MTATKGGIRPLARLSVERERMLSGFPWVTAIIIYTLSWGGSLLRPNTLYWDDWAIYFDQPIDNGLKTLKSMGRPPWGGVIEFLLLHVGPWLVCLATFVGFFSAGLFLFGILRTIPVLSMFQRQAIVLLFLVVPVNHARIAITIFDYSSSYFLFFLGWLILVRSRSIQAFLISWVLLFLSVKTHSLLFFMLVPFTHFLWLRKNELLAETGIGKHRAQSLALALLPAIYVVLRELFWPETLGLNYQTPTFHGLVVGFIPLAIGVGALILLILKFRKKRSVSMGVTLLVVGFLIASLALFPYFAGEFYVGYLNRPAYITVFEFRADWRSRHQLLMPLGLAVSVVGLNEMLIWRKKNILLSAILMISIALNMFWASQYFLMSHKQEQLVDLFRSTKNEVVIASVEDQTLLFNGRESTFRGYEWDGFMTLAGIQNERPGCEALPNGSHLILRSDTPYLRALVTRDLELYFDIQPCSEVLAQGN